MTDTTDTATEVFTTHEAFERDGDSFVLTTTAFDVRVTLGANYGVRITVPTLGGATDDHVAEVVENGWFETFCLRLEDASGATRAAVAVPEPTVEREGETVLVAFEFAHEDPAGAAEAAKTLAEYVEGTYVEGIVPGYSYVPPVSGLLACARQQGDEGSGAMPM